MAKEGVKFTESGSVLIGGTMPADVEGVGMRLDSGNFVAFWYLPNGETRDMTAAEMREWFRKNG